MKRPSSAPQNVPTSVKTTFFIPSFPPTSFLPPFNTPFRACRTARRARPASQTARANTRPASMKRDLPVPLAPNVSDVWELDFYSRPVVGLDGKKLWELIITDANANFEYVEAIPNSMVNSRELRKRIQHVIEDAPVKPTLIRFFRSQMFNMINIALSAVDVQIAPSRKTYALYQLLKHRENNVYKNMPGFKQSLSKSASSFTSLDMQLPKPLPDALRCDSFAFGTFPLGQLKHFFAEAHADDYFGDACLIDDHLSDDTLVPGMIIFSRRAKALAAWITGIELAFIRVVLERQQILLECGLNTVYQFARISDDLRDDVRAFQKGKVQAAGIHFLAVQQSQDADEVEGMWLLSDSL